MQNLVINTPAKINLGLNILRKRDDGYHDIETFFYPIKLCDTLTFSESDDFIFTCSKPELMNENNLVVKAKQLLENEFKFKIKIRIDLQKQIPIGAGLGGGSSDAAGTILGIIKFLNLNVDDTTKLRITTALGADVPYFLNPVPSYAESIGNIITPLDCKLTYPILLINPGIPIVTRWAYQHVVPSSPVYTLKKLISDCEIDFLYMQNKIKNDFEPFVFKEYPEISEIKKELYKRGAMFALMSGSGSSVFGIFPNLDKAERALEIFKNHYFTFLHHENN
ncbi:MAG: 4-(cytidine 5'-diphospho)-2-C-methyl-D-erythritol kinase [Ignavibacteriaceae bacterium]|nr:4-(cytidine 5'-diphospho)-2-C-methyl-D-erythritol kinase [Ignavibacteriaceae bacterium]